MRNLGREVKQEAIVVLMVGALFMRYLESEDGAVLEEITTVLRSRLGSLTALDAEVMQEALQGAPGAMQEAMQEAGAMQEVLQGAPGAMQEAMQEAPGAMQRSSMQESSVAHQPPPPVVM